MSKFTCPFCLRRYSKSRIPYICPMCGEKTEPLFFLHTEPVYCKHNKKDAQGNETNVPCGGVATIRRCPYCRREIPRDAIHTRNLPFSIIGVSNSGKTNYITVMLHELGRLLNLRLALSPLTAETRNRQNENYSHIYNEHTPPAATQSGMPIAQIWKISNNLRRIGNRVPSYTFTIFDGAGEDHENLLDRNSVICRYITESQAMILVVDPLILANVRQTVDANVRRNSLGGDEGSVKNAADVVNDVVDYIRKARGGSVNRRLAVPTAVVFTKFDVILDAYRDAFGSGALIRQKSLPLREDRSINLDEFYQIDEEIRNWLYQIHEEGVVNALDACFKEYLFFGVSSYGAPPVNGFTPREIKPHRALDPILWLFKKANFVK